MNERHMQQLPLNVIVWVINNARAFNYAVFFILTYVIA